MLIIKNNKWEGSLLRSSIRPSDSPIHSFNVALMKEKKKALYAIFVPFFVWVFSCAPHFIKNKKDKNKTNKDEKKMKEGASCSSVETRPNNGRSGLFETLTRPSISFPRWCSIILCK